MKPIIIIKRILDAVMYILFLLLMCECVMAGAVHEWLGISVGILFAVHNILNYRWYKAIPKGKYNAARIFALAVNILLIIAVIACAVSGILISRYIFAVDDGNAIEFGRYLHLIATAWAFVLMTIHLGLHWSVFANIRLILSRNAKVKAAAAFACRAAVSVLSGYGIFQLINRRFWEELFYLIDYQKEYDYSQPLPMYFLGTFSISVLFIAITYYVKKFFQRKKQLKKSNPSIKVK